MKIVKVLCIMLGIVVLAAGGLFLYLTKNPSKNVSNESFSDTINVTDKGFEYADAEKAKSVAVREETAVYEDIHKMANTKIVADEIWGEEEINEERLNKVIIEVMNSNFEDKDRLLEILHNWKTGNFKNAVEEHNYVWEKLGGTVGKATGLRE